MEKNVQKLSKQIKKETGSLLKRWLMKSIGNVSDMFMKKISKGLDEKKREAIHWNISVNFGIPSRIS